MNILPGKIGNLTQALLWHRGPMAKQKSGNCVLHEERNPITNRVFGAIYAATPAKHLLRESSNHSHQEHEQPEEQFAKWRWFSS
jgi:hypothetical protein